MARDSLHFHLRNLSKPEPFRAKGGGGGKAPSDVPNRAAHAQAILSAIDLLPNIAAANLPGVYLEVTSRANERLKKDSLNASNLTLLKFEDANRDPHNREKATVFATSQGIDKLRQKVTQFQNENNPDKEKNGQLVPGGPRHADLVQSISALTEAGLRALWRSPESSFPADGIAANWEVWLDPAQTDDFVQRAPAYGVAIGQERLVFPEDIVMIAHGTREVIAQAVKQIGGVKAMAAPSITADFFHGMDVQEQAQWVDELVQRTSFLPNPDPSYVTLLDTGVSRAHPLIQPALDVADRHAADFGWSAEDVQGHGTPMAGLVLYGDLTPLLHQTNPIHVNHRLESVKIIPDAGVNPHHLLGAVTQNAVKAVEQIHPRRRTFTMASTTAEDTPHDGAPTSWSSEIDQLTSGVSGDLNINRLMLISAGNTDNYSFGAGQYLDVSDHEDNEIESPAQSWNAIAVGAYTEKTQLPQGEAATALAPFGDLSPSSRTASWSAYWPLKPDVVLEGGNWTTGAMPPPMRHGWLSLLSTHQTYPLRSFTFTHDTSAATALAAKGITELWSDYPALWPETVRALYVSSARWTPQMLSHLPQEPNKGDFAPLFQRYGYGVPDLARARRSASNALTLIVEDTIVPYRLSPTTGGDIHNEMRIFSLPWPVNELRRLGTAEVKLRVTLSSFIEPNPSEAARGSKFRYASHNLRFKINRAGEDEATFKARISKLAEPTGTPANDEEDMWDFGSNRRDVGSLHIDQLSCKASDLARRSFIAVHPVTGWWKTKARLQGELPSVRYALIVEIDAEHLAADIRTEVETAIATMVATQVVTKV